MDNLPIGKVVCTAVEPHKFIDGIFNATLKIKVATGGPSVANSKSNSFFQSDDFNGALDGKYTSTRVTWMKVPAGTTIEQMNQLIASHPDCCIYRIIANEVEPVLTNEQHAAIASDKYPSINLEYYASVQSLRVSADGITPIDDKYGQPQYRQYFFSKTKEGDLDFRMAPELENSEILVEASAIH